MGLPRSRSVRRPPPGSGPSLSGDSQLGGVPRLPSTSILAKQQQVGWGGQVGALSFALRSRSARPRGHVVC